MSMPVDSVSAPVAPARLQGGASSDMALREAATALEAAFLAEMLRGAGLGAPRGAFGGGAGEEQFSSFLAEAHARALAERGGIGLAEALFRALQDNGHDNTRP